MKKVLLLTSFLLSSVSYCCIAMDEDELSRSKGPMHQSVKDPNRTAIADAKLEALLDEMTALSVPIHNSILDEYLRTSRSLYDAQDSQMIFDNLKFLRNNMKSTDTKGNMFYKPVHLISFEIMTKNYFVFFPSTQRYTTQDFPLGYALNIIECGGMVPDAVPYIQALSPYFLENISSYQQMAVGVCNAFRSQGNKWFDTIARHASVIFVNDKKAHNLQLLIRCSPEKIDAIAQDPKFAEDGTIILPVE